jgi:two-component system sensor histidine kinase KdpD
MSPNPNLPRPAAERPDDPRRDGGRPVAERPDDQRPHVEHSDAEHATGRHPATVDPPEDPSGPPLAIGLGGAQGWQAMPPDLAQPLTVKTADWPPLPGWQGLGATFLLLAAAAGLVTFGGSFLPETASPLIFLTAVLLASVVFGFWTGLIAAAVAFGMLNFLFTRPLYTFQIAHPQDLITLSVFLLVAALAGLLAGRLHDQAEAATSRAEVLAVLSNLSASLAAAHDEAEVVAIATEHLATLVKGPAATFRAAGTSPDLLSVMPPDYQPTPDELQAAERALRHHRAQAAAAEAWAGPRLTLIPLAATSGAALALGYRPPPFGRESLRRDPAIAVLVHQTGLALQRLDFAARAHAERDRAEAEATRSALLASLSHDLRTPLATILGAASSLRDLQADLSPEAKDDLLTAIVEEAARLSRHVTNLLQMTRLEAAIAPNLVWVDVADVAEAAVVRARRAFPQARIETDLGASLPMVRAEAGLLEQAVFNLIENAVRHGAPTVRVQAVSADALWVQIIVRDQGIGPPALVRDWLASPDPRPALGVRGLGLAVAKGIARVLAGDLVAAPAEAAFILRLPLPQTTQPEAAA